MEPAVFPRSHVSYLMLAGSISSSSISSPRHGSCSMLFLLTRTAALLLEVELLLDPSDSFGSVYFARSRSITDPSRIIRMDSLHSLHSLQRLQCGCDGCTACTTCNACTSDFSAERSCGAVASRTATP